MYKQLPSYLLQMQSSISNPEKTSSDNGRIWVNLPVFQVAQDILIF